MKNKGFTLIELLIVIAIVAILSGAMVPLFATVKQEANSSKVMQELEAIKAGSIQLYFDTGYWPCAANCGCSLVRNPSGNPIPDWNGPYVSAPGNIAHHWRVDPWGREYEIFDDGNKRLARSCGPDECRQTEDDIIILITPDYTKGLDPGGHDNYGNPGSLCDAPPS